MTSITETNVRKNMMAITLESMRQWLPAAAVAVLAVILTYPAAGGLFIYTDNGMVSGKVSAQAAESSNPYGGPGGAPATWTPDRPPVSAYIYNLANARFGQQPFGYHIIQLGIHAANAVLMYILLLMIFRTAGRGKENPRREIYAAAIGAALFACHPATAGDASWISAQKEVTASFLSLASACVFFHDTIKKEQKVTVWLAISVVLYMAAVFADGKAALWPLLLAAQARFAVPAGASRAERLGRTAKLLPFLALGSLAAAVYFVKGGYGGPTGPGVFDLPASFHSAAGYFIRVFKPFYLSPAETWALPGAWNTASVAGAAVLAALALLCAVALIRRNLYLWCMAAVWAFAAIVPRMFEYRDFMTDTGPYLLTAAAALAAAAVITRISFGKTRSAFRAGAGAVLALALLMTLGFATRLHIGLFSKDLSFWKAASTHYPKEADAWKYLALAYSDNADIRNAESAMKVSISLKPDNAINRAEFGIVYLKWKNPGEAEREFAAAEAAAGNNSDIRGSLAYFYSQAAVLRYNNGDYAAADADLKKAIHLDLRLAVAHATRAAVLLKMRDYQNAFVEISIASELSPGNDQIRKSAALVAEAARKAKVPIITKGVTDKFFEQLNKSGM